MDISSQLMIIPATASSASSRSAEINAAIIGFVFGSLSRPPESSSSLFSWRSFTDLVCLWLQASLSNHISLGNLSVGDVVDLWSTLESRFVHREGELRLAEFMQHHCDILRSAFELYSDDCYVFLHMESLVSKGDVMKLVHFDGLKPYISVVLDGFHATATVDLRLKFCVKTLIDCSEVLVVHVAEIATSLEMASTFPLILEDCYELLYLLFMVSEVDPLLLPLLTVRGLQIEPHTFGCFEALLISFAMRLIQSDAPHIVENALTVEVLHFFSIRKAFQRHNGLFKNMEIASDQCYLLLVCLCHDKGNSHISAPLRRIENRFESFAVVDQLVIRFVKFLPRLEKETFFFTCWLAYHEGYESPRYVTRQGEIWSSRTNSMATLIQGDSGDSGGRGTLLHFDSRELLMLIFLHPHCCEFLLNQRWWVSKKKLIFVDCHVLLLHGQSRESCFLGYKVAAHAGGLKALIDFFFGSLTRPPESQSDFSFIPLKFIWMLLSLEDCRGYEAVNFFKSKMDFHLEGEYQNRLVYIGY